MKCNTITSYLGLTREILLISSAKITSHVSKRTVNLVKMRVKFDVCLILSSKLSKNTNTIQLHIDDVQIKLLQLIQTYKFAAMMKIRKFLEIHVSNLVLEEIIYQTCSYSDRANSNLE